MLAMKRKESKALRERCVDAKEGNTDMSRKVEPERFQKTFDAYFLKWWMVIGILYFVAFSVYIVLIFNRESPSKFPSFLGWIGTVTPWMNNILFGAVGIGFISVGALAVGIVAIGACSVGIVAVGGFSVGIFAFGGNALGLIAIGAGTRYGWINPKSTPRGRFDIGKVAGIVAVGPAAYGLYTLSYAGKSRYMFSPDRQDTEAVALFTRWLPKFEKTFSASS